MTTPSLAKAGTESTMSKHSRRHTNSKRGRSSYTQISFSRLFHDTLLFTLQCAKFSSASWLNFMKTQLCKLPVSGNSFFVILCNKGPDSYRKLQFTTAASGNSR